MLVGVLPVQEDDRGMAWYGSRVFYKRKYPRHGLVTTCSTLYIISTN